MEAYSVPKEVRSALEWKGTVGSCEASAFGSPASRGLLIGGAPARAPSLVVELPLQSWAVWGARRRAARQIAAAPGLPGPRGALTGWLPLLTARTGRHLSKLLRPPHGAGIWGLIRARPKCTEATGSAGAQGAAVSVPPSCLHRPERPLRGSPTGPQAPTYARNDKEQHTSRRHGPSRGEVGSDKVGELETPPMSFLRKQMHGIAPRSRRCFQPRLTPAPGIHGTHCEPQRAHQRP
ncbi:hypothetical protein NDU88_006245 [Pleurodeles waltl]|uniref:Uncharacterized protein n=1 Tax=Pleurodeles waltl TaxID=8319 RepID=A0AAV7PKA6_PLEWA|nr:hypothetical protein NDU88_006245 [Pleurodeles waltl]